MLKFNCLYLYLLLCIYSCLVTCQKSQFTDSGSNNLLDDDLYWKGRWFPYKPNEVKQQKDPSLFSKDGTDHIDFQYLEDPPHQSMMLSMVNSTCDDGKTNISIDWPKTPSNYTCVSFRKQYFWPDESLPAIIHKSFIPVKYKARHVCMDQEITYSSDLPTYGPHRPAWPRYGEYKFLPRQRWIHSLEHGAVVMLYHPCAHPFIVQEIKDIVKSCLYRHVITPYSLLPHDRPYALLTWGWSILLPDFDEKLIVKFIREHALRGPENMSTDGQYDYQLIESAKYVTDPNDSEGLCPDFKNTIPYS